jgi:hypothetical protein
VRQRDDPCAQFAGRVARRAPSTPLPVQQLDGEPRAVWAARYVGETGRVGRMAAPGAAALGSASDVELSVPSWGWEAACEPAIWRLMMAPPAGPTASQPALMVDAVRAER